GRRPENRILRQPLARGIEQQMDGDPEEYEQHGGKDRGKNTKQRCPEKPARSEAAGTQQERTLHVRLSQNRSVGFVPEPVQATAKLPAPSTRHPSLRPRIAVAAAATRDRDPQTPRVPGASQSHCR